METVHDALSISQKARKVATLAPGARVRIVGLWIWIDFESKPGATVRAMLKAEKFRWNHSRGCWQFAGVKSRKSRGGRWAIEARYGVQEVEVA